MVDNWKNRLSSLIAEPQLVRRDDIPFLQELSEHYPYFQPVHLLYALACKEESNRTEALTHAALYTDGQLLHNFFYAPQALIANDFNILQQENVITAVLQPEEIDDFIVEEVPAAETQPENLAAAEMTAEDEPREELFQEDFQQEASADDHPVQESSPAEEDAAQDIKQEDDLVLENIVATDFFAFQDNFNVEMLTEEQPEEESLAQPSALHSGQPETSVELPVAESNISKYDDDRLPYTFLWWLAKTRKEHEQVFQPYASPKHHPSSKTNAEQLTSSGQLQHQYVEHIFHLQSPFSEEEKAHVPTSSRQYGKEDEIIDNFIKNEPQISPPNTEQINNDNKARRSAEDNQEVVSETLGNIYLEQMLYDKAIETYEKLSLKFPEKSRYFADLIHSIRKKI